MSENKQYVLPKEYDGQYIDIDEYMNKRREDALNNARTRKESYPKPTWWNEKKNKGWLDCIATATSNYGEGSIEYGNPRFYYTPDKYGFRRLADNEPSLPGDIAQMYYIDDKGKSVVPEHGYMINEVDGDGKIKSINYSDGHGHYQVGSYNHFDDDDNHYMGPALGADGEYYDMIGKRRAYRYRYIGTPAERAAIEAHNADIRARNAPPKPIQPPIRGVTVSPAPTQKKPLSIFDVAKGEE